MQNVNSGTLCPETAPTSLIKDSGVLLVGNFLSSSLGAHAVCEDLAIQLAKRGWSVITTSNKAGKLSRVTDMLSTVWKKRDLYAAANVDVYSGRSFFWAEAVCELLKSIGKPYVLTLHGGNLPVFARRWPTRVRRLLGSADAVIAPSRYLYEQMASYRHDLILVPNGLDLGVYNFRLRSRPRPALIWFRTFHSIYNPTLAPHVLWSLAGEFPDITLVMAGPDGGDESLNETRKTAKRLGVDTRLEISGKIEKQEVAKYLHLGDIFLNTANTDNTPVSVLEAMACGLCVVSTNVGGIPYLLEHESDGLLVPPKDPSLMAAAIRRILLESHLPRRLSNNARRKAALFDWSVVIPQWNNLLSIVINS